MAYTPKTWTTGETIDAAELNAIEQGVQGAAATADSATTALAGKANTASLAPVATAGTYASLTGKPTIPATPADIGAQPAGSYATTTALAAKLDKGAIVPIPSGARLAVVGDSNGANGNNLTHWLNYGFPSSIDGRSILLWATLLSKGRVCYAGSYAVGGLRTAAIHSTQVPQVLAASPRPDACLVVAGTNDTADFTSQTSFDAWKVEYAGLADDLAAGGVLPVLSTVLPRQTWTSNDISGLTRQNMWLQRFAAERGYPLVDFFTTTAQESGAFYVSTLTAAGDNLHLNEAGAKACGQVLADTLGKILPAGVGAPLVTSQMAVGGVDAWSFNNGLALNDTNADGVPDGWSTLGGGTVTTITDTAKAPRGKVVKTVRGASTDAQTWIGSIPLVVGNRYMVAFRLAANIKTVGGRARYNLATTDGATAFFNFSDLVEDVPDGSVWWSDFSVPATSPTTGAVTTATANFSVFAKTATGAECYAGQVSVMDMTTKGVL